MFKIIRLQRYQDLVSDLETLGDRCRFLESKLRNADNAIAALSDKLQPAHQLKDKVDKLEAENQILSQDIDQAQEQVAIMQKRLADIKQELADSQAWTKHLEEQNKNHIEAIATALDEADKSSKAHNLLTVEHGLLKAQIENYRRNVAIAVEEFSTNLSKLGENNV